MEANLPPYISAFYSAKRREQAPVFAVENEKVFAEIARECPQVIAHICVERSFFAEHQHLFVPRECFAQRLSVCRLAFLRRISSLKTNDRLVVFIDKDPFDFSTFSWPLAPKEWVIVLDGLSDPRNLGAIMRTADWFGCKRIICSAQTVNWHNPKVIQASMGSWSRLQMIYTDPVSVLRQASHPIYLSTPSPAAAHSLWREQAYPDGGFLLIGSESHGVSRALAALATQHVHIPRKGGGQSLNVAVALGILLAQLTRRQ